MISQPIEARDTPNMIHVRSVKFSSRSKTLHELSTPFTEVQQKAIQQPTSLVSLSASQKTKGSKQPNHKASHHKATDTCPFSRLPDKVSFLAFVFLCSSSLRLDEWMGEFLAAKANEL